MNNELQKRISQFTNQEFISIYKIEKNYEIQMEQLKANIKINLDKGKSKVDIALLNNGFDIEEDNDE